MADKIKDLVDRQWHVLFIYNLYRVLSVFLFLGIYYYTPNPISHSYEFFYILVTYFILTLFFLYFGYWRLLSFEKQVLISGTIDVIALTTMLSLVSNMRSGQGILLNVTIAALSILVPGRLAVFFASLASCLLLGGNFFQLIFYSQNEAVSFYHSGMYGAGLFGTALTAWYLANWAKQSEHLAIRRSDELKGMQRINEYIIERLHSGVIYTTEQQEILLVNTAARQFFGIKPLHEPVFVDQFSTELAKKLSNFVIQIRQKELVAQSVIENPNLRVHFYSISIKNKLAVLMIFDDMTSITQQAQQLKLASLGRFSASIAHELRNPLGVVAHAAQLLGEDDSLNDEDKHLKELIINNCKRMNGVIKNVLQLSRREQSKPEIIDVASFLDQFKYDFKMTNQCDLKIKTIKTGVSIFFDKSQLEQVLVVLCENVLKHGLDEAGLAHITISAKATAQKVSIIINDTGPGVALEHQNTIFEPFFTTLLNGTGMGLFIARDLCEMNQARLNLIKTGTGSSFSITQNPSDEFLL